MVRKLVLSLIVVMGVCAVAFAQNRQISGTVVDTEGAPVIGATVVLESNPAVGTSTGVDGSFSISAPASGNIVISFLGYKTQIISVVGRTRVNVAIESDATVINTVEVVGYGSGSKVGTSIGSVAKVKGEQLENKPVANVADALQGKVAGLQVYTSSGEPTEVSTMRLHGVGSLTAGSSPLIVLDGVPVSMETLLSLNSNDIESVNTLKDASATSIYGSRAANGVIYITMKKGRRGEDARVVINAQYGISQPASGKYNVMNTTQLADYELFHGYIDQELRDKRVDSGINTNWRDYYYRSNAPTYQADISVTGGSEKTAYYIAGGFMSQDGTAPRSNLTKYTFRTNVDSNVKDWMRVGSNITMAYDERSSAHSTGNSVYNAAFISLLSRPDSSPYDEDGNEMEKIDGYYNPNYYATKFPAMARKYQVNANAYVQITPIEGLSIKSVFGLDGIWFTNRSARMASYSGRLNNGSALRMHQDMQTVSITNTIDYNFKFANTDHQLYLLAGQEGLSNSATTFMVSRDGQINDNLMMISNGVGVPTASDSYSSYLFNSWFGRAEYSYERKYYVDGTVRRDASSRFGPNNRSALFWSAGFMWDVKRESFLFNNKTISDLKFKVSYGTQGNASIPDYAHQTFLNYTTYNDAGAIYLGQYGNPDLGWETQRLLTVAANIGLWSNRLSLEVEFYNRITGNMLMSVPLPATSGYMAQFQNVGSMRNRGVDLTINADIVRTTDWLVNFRATFTYGRSIITKLFNGYEEYAIPNAGLCYRVGHDAGEFYLPVFKGIDELDGTQIWEGIDENGAKYDTKEFSEATKQLVGESRYAPYAGGFGVNAAWKGISVSADFTWSYGKSLINNARYFIETPTYLGQFNRSTELLKEWRNPGDITNVPASGEEIQFDTHLLEDASFLRLKNLTVGYDLPKTWMNKTKVISSIRIYFTARNLLTFTGYTGYDPEVDSNLSLGDYPNSRQFVGGVQITF